MEGDRAKIGNKGASGGSYGLLQSHQSQSLFKFCVTIMGFKGVWTIRDIIMSMFIEFKLIRIKFKVQGDVIKRNDFPDPLELKLGIRIYHFALQLGLHKSLDISILKYH